MHTNLQYAAITRHSGSQILMSSIARVTFVIRTLVGYYIHEGKPICWGNVVANCFIQTEKCVNMLRSTYANKIRMQLFLFLECAYIILADQ